MPKIKRRVGNWGRLFERRAGDCGRLGRWCTKENNKGMKHETFDVECVPQVARTSRIVGSHRLLVGNSRFPGISNMCDRERVLGGIENVPIKTAGCNEANILNEKRLTNW